ncbi:MAG: CopY family transcriptional regulator [Terriglobia bacterium]|nr:MAG: CopY family transcriptional regulator [Terriglobia bacterium]
MPRTARDTPPPLELLCLQALWTLEEGDVKKVQAVVSQSRPLAYTTIMTVLERLVRKGKLRRRKKGRAFLYSPELSRDAMRRAAIRELVEGFFDGSEQDLLRFLQHEEPRAAVAAAPARSEEASIDTVLL